jgi:hypothetical protein
MYLMPPVETGRGNSPNELETLVLSDRHLDYLGQISLELNPDMPASFGLPHLIRTILDRVEQSGIDLTDACSEEEIAELAGKHRAEKRRALTRGFFLRSQQLDDLIDRVCLRQICTTLESRLDQTADDLRAADGLPVPQPDVDGQAIEIGDMTVEKNDRDFRPGLGVDNRTTAIALCRTHTHSCCYGDLTGKVGRSVPPSPAQVYLSVPT